MPLKLEFIAVQIFLNFTVHAIKSKFQRYLIFNNGTQNGAKMKSIEVLIPTNTLSQNSAKIPISFGVKYMMCAKFACSLSGKQSKEIKYWSRLEATLNHFSVSIGKG